MVTGIGYGARGMTVSRSSWFLQWALDRGLIVHRHVMRVLLVTVAALGALVLVGGLANAAPAVTGGYGSGGAKGTCTTLVTSPATTVAQGAQVTLTAMVAPAAAAGMVQFKDGATALSTVAVTNGTAATTVTFATAGAHSLTAVFTPTDPAAFTSSTSPAVPLTVTGSAPTSPAAVQVTTPAPATVPAQVVTPAPAQVTVLSATDDNQGLLSNVVEGAGDLVGGVL